MYPYRHPEVARNRMAELHHEAHRDALVIGRRRARGDRSGRAIPARLARAARHMLALDRMRAGRRPASAG
jgi:hypothetical protein